MAMEVAGHRGRGNEMSRRATARLRPPEPDEPLPIQYTDETRSAAQALDLEPVSNGEAANGQAPAHAVDLAAAPAPQPEPPMDQMDQMDPVNGNGLALELEPLAEVEKANGSISADAPEPPVQPINGHDREPADGTAADPEPVRFKWDPKTGQAVPVT